MKTAIYVLLFSGITALTSCEKISNPSVNPNPYARVQIFGFYSNKVAATLFNLTDAQNQLLQLSSKDTATASSLIKAGNLNINSTYSFVHNPSNTFQWNKDTVVQIAAQSTYSIFSFAGRCFTTTVPNNTISTANSIGLIKEKDTTAPARGFAKLRLLVATNGSGPGVCGDVNKMYFALYGPGDSVIYGHRHYMDHLQDTTRVQFTTIRAGNYQMPISVAQPFINFTFESGKIYTLLVNNYTFTQYPTTAQIVPFVHRF